MEKKYEDIVKELIHYVGGEENIQTVTHCATRLRLVLLDNDKIEMSNVENLRLAKGAFVAGDQLQIVFGAGLVNSIYQEVVEFLGMSNTEVKTNVKASSKTKQNPLQKFIKSISDVFIEIMPSILAAALLMGLTSLLSTKGLFGSESIVEMVPAISGINRMVSIASSGIFALLPMIVAYSATKRFGGRPALGLAIGAIMIHPNLADAFGVAGGSSSPEVVNVFGLSIELVGFQGGIIIALMIGYIVAKLDELFNKVLPDIIKFVLSPMLTILISSLLLFTIIGPFGRELGNGLTNGLLWMTEHLGILGFMIFAGVQQIIVITGLHHTFGAIESQLVANTGRDFLNPLMSVALVAQGGAVLGYMLLHRKNKKIREISISAFTSVLFGISEPALFGVTVKYKFPLIAGCIAGAISGGYVFLSKLTAVGYGTTGLPGFTIVDPANNGYLHFVVAHLIAVIGGITLTYAFGKVYERKNTDEKDIILEENVASMIEKEAEKELSVFED
ncbi:PTS transporter subunit EIIC [Enterococcus gilvus]|uniref:PTS system, glucose-like IIB component n=1 Tax=Enterococcus gilvus ATCC BAA-350 TaxID=1158614 RepID=R2XKL3_9ENTE|nr:PTS transporter subunit EIIC [Enterococcus gilvus]EOI55464.1 PTS system, glucose-like IIB component [Enterococcus gilvus ATCC BAA-350]EOW81993.1 hypothetical protein I592_01294 [Enterococcus gilvus ATCC BAA-350]OJG43022.1 PTS system, glucose-like IIB component [Enterococcus gilvus]